MKKFLIRLTVEEDGQDLIEYALLAGSIALASTAMIHEHRHGREHRLHRGQHWGRRRIVGFLRSAAGGSRRVVSQPSCGPPGGSPVFPFRSLVRLTVTRATSRGRLWWCTGASQTDRCLHRLTPKVGRGLDSSLRPTYAALQRKNEMQTLLRQLIRDDDRAGPDRVRPACGVYRPSLGCHDHQHWHRREHRLHCCQHRGRRRIVGSAPRGWGSRRMVSQSSCGSPGGFRVFPFRSLVRLTATRATSRVACGVSAHHSYAAIQPVNLIVSTAWVPLGAPDKLPSIA